MPLDPSIISGLKPVQFDPTQFSSMNAMTNIMKFKQADEASQLNALKMQEAQAALTERNALRGLDPTASDYESQLFKVSPALGIQFRKEQATAGAQTAAKNKSEFDLKAAQRKFGDDLRRGLSANPSDENIIAFGQDALLQGLYTEDQVKATVQQLLGLKPEDRVRILSQAGATAGELRPVTVGSSLMTPQGQLLATAPRQPQLLTPEEEAQKARIALAGRAPAQPRAEQPPVAVVGPDGKQIYVSREDAVRNRMTPASAMESLAPKEIQAREAKFPAATSAVKTFETSAERLAVDLEKLAVHPGLSGISGLVYGRTPAITKDARAAQALYDSIVARGGFQELQNMRASSPTGGALGNVSNQEGQYLRDAFAPINRTQDTTDLSRVLTEAAGATRSSKQRLRDAYDMTYDYKSQGKAPAPAAAAGAPNIDALLNKYK